MFDKLVAWFHGSESDALKAQAWLTAHTNGMLTVHTELLAIAKLLQVANVAVPQSTIDNIEASITQLQAAQLPTKA